MVGYLSNKWFYKGLKMFLVPIKLLKFGFGPYNFFLYIFSPYI